MVGKFERDEEPKKKKKDAVDGGAAAEVRPEVEEKSRR